MELALRWLVVLAPEARLDMFGPLPVVEERSRLIKQLQEISPKPSKQPEAYAMARKRNLFAPCEGLIQAACIDHWRASASPARWSPPSPMHARRGKLG